jgi:RimJ/RimL family protein N-acetyltransferase
VLRELAFDDWPTVHAYQSEPAYLRYYPWAQRKPEDVQELVRMLVAYQQESPRTKFQFAVTLEGRLIGTCGVRRRAADATEADVGMDLAPSCWAQGYAQEAMNAVFRFGFGELKLHRLWAQCIADNEAAVRLVERLGMTREGRLRETTRIAGRWHDSFVYGLLAHEWKRA